MKVSTVSFSEINKTKRINAGYHLSEGTLYERKITQMPHKKIEDVTKDVFTAGRSKRIYTDKEFGYPYLSNSNVTKQIPFEGCKYNSKKYAYEETALLTKNMTVTGRVGAIGQTAFITKKFEELKSMGSDNIIRLVPNESIKPGYLYTFFASKYGKTLLLKLSAGGVQPYISEKMVKKIPIPIFSKIFSNQIHQKIIQASDNRDKANDILEQCEEKLYSLLGINKKTLSILTNPSEIKVEKHFTIKSSNINKLTFRARNYSPRKKRIIETLSSNKHNDLGSLLMQDPFYGSRYKRIESKSKNGIYLLSQGEIFEKMPLGRKISKKTISNIENDIVKKGTILVPAQGTLGENEIFGRAKFVWGYLEGKLVAGHSMRFIPNEDVIDPGYLFCVLNSALWFRLFRTSVYGTNLLGFIIPILKDLPVPRFSSTEESAIGILVKQAYTLFTEANDLESAAILELEKEIEKWQE